MSGSVDILRATVRDASAILALQRLAYEEQARIYQDWTIPPLTETLEEVEEDLRRSVCLKACTDGLLIGSVRGRATGDVCEVGRLMVHPDHRRRGIGGCLLEAIEACFPNVSSFELFTGVLSLENIRLYERAGYKATRRERQTARVELVYLEKRRSG